MNRPILLTMARALAARRLRRQSRPSNRRRGPADGELHAAH